MSVPAYCRPLPSPDVGVGRERAARTRAASTRPASRGARTPHAIRSDAPLLCARKRGRACFSRPIFCAFLPIVPRQARRFPARAASSNRDKCRETSAPHDAEHAISRACAECWADALSAIARRLTKSPAFRVWLPDAGGNQPLGFGPVGQKNPSDLKSLSCCIIPVHNSAHDLRLCAGIDGRTER
jgi:hypothetical protein